MRATSATLTRCVAAALLAACRPTSGEDPSAGAPVSAPAAATAGGADGEARERHRVLADSLWRAGRVAFGSEGVPAAIRLFRESLRHANQAADSAARGVALGALGAGFYALGELDSADGYLGEARRLAAMAGDQRTLGNAIGNLASVAKDRGQLRQAAVLYEEASAIRSRIGDTRGLASDQNNLGLLARTLGDLGAARRAFENALALNRSGGHSRYAAINLTNLGDLASLDGDYSTAQTAYDEALAFNRASGDLAESAFVLHRLGLLAGRRGDLPGASGALHEALDLHQKGGADMEAALVRTDLAMVQAAMGLFQEADSTLRPVAGPSIDTFPRPVRARLALAQADLDVQLGRLEAASTNYGRAESWLADSGSGTELADVQRARGLMLFLRDDHLRAAQVLEPAVHRQVRDGDRRGAAITRLLLAETQLSAGNPEAARRSAGDALAAFVATGDVPGEVAALILRGDLALAAGAPVQAETWYRRAITRLGVRPIPDMRWRAFYGLGQAQLARGARDQAVTHLRQAAAVVERTADLIAPGAPRAGFLADKWQVHTTLARVELSLRQPGRAFATSERMRSRQLLALLDRGRVRTRDQAGEREQDLRRRIGELTLALETAGRGTSRREPGQYDLSRSSTGATLEALNAAQGTYANLLEELRTSDPGYLSMVMAEPSGWQDVARRLGRQEVLLEYLLSDSASFVFVVTPDTIVSLELGVRRRDLAALVDFARHGLGQPDSGQGASLGHAPLRRLYAILIEPVERAGFLRDRSTLIVVPHAELHFLPFAALHGPGPHGRYLAQDFDLVHAPSASVWTRRHDQARGKRPRSVLALAPRIGRLPGTAREMTTIRRAFGRNATTLQGEEATESALRARTPGRDIIHIATIGMLNKHNPLFSYIELAQGPEDDGRLEVHEVFDLDLKGQLVVLSACQTGLASGRRADVPAGDEWVGLVQSFLEAGARSVVASLWPVQDRATADLMDEFYRRLARGEPPSSALGAAQRAVLRRPGTAHPFYWAGFVLSGTGNR